MMKVNQTFKVVSTQCRKVRYGEKLCLVAVLAQNEPKPIQRLTWRQGQSKRNGSFWKSKPNFIISSLIIIKTYLSKYEPNQGPSRNDKSSNRKYFHAQHFSVLRSFLQNIFSISEHIFKSARIHLYRMSFFDMWKWLWCVEL